MNLGQRRYWREWRGNRRYKTEEELKSHEAKHGLI